MDLRILEIASYTENNKIIKNFTHKTKNKNPLCGDEIEISLVVENDVIKDMGYQSKSCIYCEASASLLSRKIKKKKIYEIQEFISSGEKLFDDVKTNLDINWKDFREILNKKHFTRKECLLLPIKTIAKILNF